MITHEGDGEYSQYFLDGVRKFIIYQGVDDNFGVVFVAPDDTFIFVGNYSSFDSANFMVSHLIHHVK